MTAVPVLPAASVLIVDDRPDLHVLIGRRRPGSVFVGGMIVFPGGGVDPEDREPSARARVPAAVIPDMAADAAAAFLHAAVREAHEEVGLDIAGDGPLDPDRFPHVGRWITPEGSPRRYDTHFFLARYRGGTPVPDLEELTEVWWERPRDTLARIDEGDLVAVTPTVAFLRSLSRYSTAGEAFVAASRARRDGPDDGWTAL